MACERCIVDGHKLCGGEPHCGMCEGCTAESDGHQCERDMEVNHEPMES